MIAVRQTGKLSSPESFIRKHNLERQVAISLVHTLRLEFSVVMISGRNFGEHSFCKIYIVYMKG